MHKLFIVVTPPAHLPHSSAGGFPPGTPVSTQKQPVLPCDFSLLYRSRPDRPATFLLLLYFYISSLFLPVYQSRYTPPPSYIVTNFTK